MNVNHRYIEIIIKSICIEWYGRTVICAHLWWRGRNSSNTRYCSSSNVCLTSSAAFSTTKKKKCEQNYRELSQQQLSPSLRLNVVVFFLFLLHQAHSYIFYSIYVSLHQVCICLLFAFSSYESIVDTIIFYWKLLLL